jgi:hypothetical protein
VEAPRWRFLLAPRWLAWHAFAVVAFWGMCWLGDWQLHRALAGNALSWAYTVEWPIFAVTGAVFWARTVRDEFRLRDEPPDAETRPDAETWPDARTPLDGARLPAADAYRRRLSEEVRGHGRWHGLR